MKKRMDEYFDVEKNLKQRDELMTQAFKEGYWDDPKEIARKGAKLWEAPKTLRAQNISPALPVVKGTNLLGTPTDLHTLLQNKISLVTFVFTAFGEPHAQSFIDPFVKEFGGVEGCQLVQLNIEENWAKAPFLRMCTPLIRRRIPKEQQANYIMHYTSIEQPRKQVGMTNRLLGWANLVDRQGRIRWQAHGVATEGEIKTLIEGTRSLLRSRS
ncbi:Mitochondrial ATPase complex subunit atp10 [Quaeritorhiza haematococci]|nr:Mitochondrial ATPase complex subunit atp10 [Quaeritorhiza haematococci]